MNKVAILVLADTETHGDLGRAVNALEVAKEFKEAGDRVTIVFDGAGTRWIAELSNPEHKRHAFEQHPSIRSLVNEGYQVITF